MKPESARRQSDQLKPQQMRILLVDDEENILKSLTRSFRSEPYRVEVAQSGDAALRKMKNTRFDLILSDARMPGLDGPTLLATVKKRYPSCIRILLTGYTDLASTIRAINDGEIYRFIKKPWNDEDLRITVRQALMYQYSERRRKSLEKLTNKQNADLKALNNNLESLVQTRTEALSKAANELESAYNELHRSYVTSTEVFSALLSQRLPPDRQTNARVVALVRAFAEFRQLDADLPENLVMAAALFNLGKLTWPDELFETSLETLGKQQKSEYINYPVRGEQLLLPLDQLRVAAKFIRHHQEQWNGRGVPDGLVAQQIPFGSRLLKIVVDYTGLQAGFVVPKKLSRDEAISWLSKQRGRLYDPQLVDQFIDMLVKVAPDVEKKDESSLQVDVVRLIPGMTLAKDLYSSSGVLLLKENKVLTATLIEKLAAFERMDPKGVRYKIHIRAE